MNTKEKIRSSAMELLAENNSESVGKAADLLKTIADIEEQEASAQKLKVETLKSEQDLKAARSHWKDFLVAATPLLTTAILAGTLIFQIKQAHQAELDKQTDSAQQEERSERARFTDGLKSLLATDGISPAAALLSSFTTEPEKTQARQMAQKLMQRAKTADEYEDLFYIVYPQPTTADLKGLLQLDSDVISQYNQLTFSVWDNAQGKLLLDKLDPAQKLMLDVLLDELTFLSQQISPLILADGQKSASLDLSNVGFNKSSLKGADLKNAKIAGSSFTSVDVDDCDLGGVTEFANATFYSEVWWHARHISPQLLEFLKNKYPFNPQTTYINVNGISRAEYEANLKRLEGDAR